VAYFYIGADRDQLFLMPVSMHDWIEEGHLAAPAPAHLGHPGDLLGYESGGDRRVARSLVDAGDHGQCPHLNTDPSPLITSGWPKPSRPLLGGRTCFPKARLESACAS
jgi:hypothetical protein